MASQESSRITLISNFQVLLVSNVHCNFSRFHCKRWLSVLQREVEIEPNVKLECASRFCYLGDKVGGVRRRGSKS